MNIRILFSNTFQDNKKCWCHGVFVPSGGPFSVDYSKGMKERKKQTEIQRDYHLKERKNERAKERKKNKMVTMCCFIIIIVIIIIIIISHSLFLLPSNIITVSYFLHAIYVYIS